MLVDARCHLLDFDAYPLLYFNPIFDASPSWVSMLFLFYAHLRNRYQIYDDDDSDRTGICKRRRQTSCLVQASNTRFFMQRHLQTAGSKWSGRYSF